MPATPGRASAVAGGVAAAVAALGGGELTAAIFSAAASPLLSVGSLVVDLTPPFLKSAVIAAFGTGDKPFLVVVLVTLVVLLGAAAGLLQRWRPPIGMALPALSAVVAALAAVTRSGASLPDAAPSVVGGVVGVFVLGLLVHPVREPLYARRRAVLGAAVWAAAGVAAGVVAQSVGSASRDVARTIAGLRLPRPSSSAPPPPAAARLDVPGITPLATANDGFYRIDIALAVPAIEPDDWSLTVVGEVERPLTLSWSDLVAMPTVESPTTLMCVSNSVGGPLNGTAVWQGVPIRRVLEMVRPRAGADMVLSSGSDGFSASTPLSVLQDPDRASLLAIGMNGRPLPQLHGFPVRMVVPGLYGYVSATKWLTKLEVTRFSRATAYWTTRGYSAEAPVKLSSRIDVPASGAAAGPVVVAGVAWAQHTGVARVQLQVDDGPWRDCELAEDWSVDVWRQWRYRWIATEGGHVLRVRATDRRGVVQTAALAGEAPNGATGLHTVRVTIA